jgi:predicted ribosome quality control (RQC) complex YloA/Tae2 family protein
MLSFGQMKSYCDWIFSRLEGAQAQNIWTDGECLVFEFYLQGPSFLCFDLGSKPQIAWLNQRPPIKKLPKPVTLFLNSHGKNLRLCELSVDESKGRVIKLELASSEKSCVCLAQLVPKNTNFFVQSEGKSISWNKPKDLPPLQSSSVQDEPEMDWVFFGQQWLEARNPRQKDQGSGDSASPTGSPKANSEEKTFLRSIEKKKKAIDAIRSQQSEDPSARYLELGEILKYASQAPRDLPTELEKLYDKRLSLKQNREKCFQKVKDFRRKQEGTLARLQELERQVEKLEQDWKSGAWQQAAAKKSDSRANQILQKADSKARKLALPDGLEAAIGKSAKDNLAILRQARAWDLWFHLRDFPGAYAILFRNKNQNVSDAIISQVSQWIVDESVGKKQISSGGTYAVLVAECRFVKPVKGATGLVTFQNERVFNFRSRSLSSLFDPS